MSKLYIPISLDYGAEEYIWESNFTSIDEIIKWWLSITDLYDFENKIKNSKYFIPVCNEFLQNQFYDLVFNNSISINLIDGNKDLSNLILNRKKTIFQNGKIHENPISK